MQAQFIFYSKGLINSISQGNQSKIEPSFHIKARSGKSFFLSSRNRGEWPSSKGLVMISGGAAQCMTCPLRYQGCQAPTRDDKRQTTTFPGQSRQIHSADKMNPLRAPAVSSMNPFIRTQNGKGVIYQEKQDGCQNDPLNGQNNGCDHREGPPSPQKRYRQWLHRDP